LLIAATPPSDPWSTLGMGGPGPGATGTSAKGNAEAQHPGWGERMVSGGSFLLDASAAVESLWGGEERVIWPDGEGLMLTGTQGVGKTTLAQQVVLSLIGVLNAPVLDCQWSLNVASYTSQWTGRTRFGARSGDSAATNIGMCSMRSWSSGRGRLLRIWPNTLRSSPKLAEQADADVVVVDSLKDAAVGLSEDEVGAGWNRAAQGLLATGRNLLVLHHRKKQTKNAWTGLDDIYGSTWLTSGMGSVVLLDGNPGDPLVEFRHLKFPVSEVGPMKVSHDQASGLMTVAEQVDLVAVAQAEGSITVKQAALLLFGSTSRNDVEKARRQTKSV
jgi:hypothetical protein